MSSIPHIPAVRRGRPYQSLDNITVRDHRTGEGKATISSVNTGIIRKDLQRIDESRAALKKFTVKELIDICAKAGDLFLNGTLPLGDNGRTQTLQHYVETLSATSGLPHVLLKRNMAKIHQALANMKMVLT